MAAPVARVDRQTTTPFLLKLFHQEGSFPPLSDFQSPSLSHIPVYAWPNSTLRELAHLLCTSIPTPQTGTTLSFRLIYPDPRSSIGAAASTAPGRFLSRDLGTVVLGDGAGALPTDEEEEKLVAGGPVAGRLLGEPEVMLRDMKFVVGDFVAVAILPPGAHGTQRNGSLSGPVGGRGGDLGFARGGRRGDEGFPGRGGGGGGFPNSRDDDNGFRGGFRGRGRVGSGGGGFGPPNGGGRPEFPSGEWRRGESIPDGSMGGGGFRGGRGRDRDRW